MERLIQPSGTYTYQTINANGCDSVATLNLTINQPTTSMTAVSECVSYSWNGTVYTISGNYTYQTIITNGCDSTATLEPNDQSTDDIYNRCCGMRRHIYGMEQLIQQVERTPSQTTNTNGCDSIATLNLTINQPTYIYNRCCGMLHLICGTEPLYTTSGTYTYQTTNANGCDSIATLNLTINQPTTSTTAVAECAYFLSPGTDTTLHYKRNVHLPDNQMPMDAILLQLLNLNHQSAHNFHD